MPEPVLSESVTDIDGSRAGELEVDLTGFGGHGGDAHLWQGTLEVETRVTDHLGLAVEFGYSWASTPESGPGLRVAASWSLLHNFEIGLHGQVELSARFVGQVENGPNLGDSRLPFSGAFRLGLDRQWWTLRLGVGAATGGAPSAHAIPAFASVTVFLNFGEGRWCSLGLDSLADWTRPNPFTVAPTLLLNGNPIHLPWKIGVVALYGPSGGGQPSWFGLVVRLIGDFDFAKD